MSRRRMIDGSIFRSRSRSRSLGSLACVVAVVLGVLLVGVGRQAHASGPAGLLPNLVADPPDNASLETSATDGGLSKEGEPRQLLRFNGYIHNDGSGALDIRGERSAPQVSQKTTNEVEAAREHNEEVEYYEEGSLRELPQKTEEELAIPEMKVFQRLYTTNAGNPEESKKYLERPYETHSSAAKMVYVNADGHHHWHLQHVAKYSLWNSEKTAEVAPAEKVGFCLEDSKRMEVEPHGERGPTEPVYSDEAAPGRDFCERFRPNATSLYEGISPGWRDEYTSNLGFQWVDTSNVLPGEYWLREEVNPEKTISEEGLGSKVSYAEKPTIIPGFDAQAQTTGTGIGQPVTVMLESMKFESTKWKAAAKPTYTIVSSPAHGTLSQSGPPGQGGTLGQGGSIGQGGSLEKGDDQVTYTPQAGYKGLDSFTFYAADPNSEFPRNPAVATVSIDVGEGQFQPSVAIEGAPSSMIAGTSVQLSAKVSNDGPAIAWEAGGGSITAGGLYTAPSEPPPGGAVLVSARGEDGAADQRTIAILPIPPAVAAPVASPSTQAPGGGRSTPGGRTPARGLSRPQGMLIGRELIMTTRVTEAGRVRLSAYLGRRELGGCVARTPADRTFTCRLKLGRGISTDARIGVLASLRVGATLLQQSRPAARVQAMKMAGGSGVAGVARLLHVRVRWHELSGRLVCAPELGAA
jgi:hypothetical protein